MAKASSSPLEKFKMAYREVSMGEKRKDFWFHTMIFVVINVVLFAINYMYTPQVWWFQFPLVLWLLGLYLHYVFGVYTAEKWIVEKQKKAESKIRRR